MDAWRAWLTDVEPDDAARRLTAERANLELLVTDARSVPAETARAFLKTLAAALPAPDRTLALRAIQAPLYGALVDLAQDDSERAWALNNLGVALRAYPNNLAARKAITPQAKWRKARYSAGDLQGGARPGRSQGPC
ncbi:MAG: hypothetical protein J7455_18285 [Roseiflexus sp.]|nr:hypothetical protein [Roseiflexus sp.]